MDDIKNQNQPNESTNDYQKILDEYAASIKPEETPEPEPEKPITASLEEVKSNSEPSKEVSSEPLSLKGINAPQLESPVHPSLAANLEEDEPDYQKPSFNQPEKISPVDSIKTEFTPPTPPVTPEPEKTPEQIKAEINKILSDDGDPATQPETYMPPKSGLNFFRLLFVLSLILFFGVAAALAYTLFSGKTTDNKTDVTQVTPTTNPHAGEVCELNGQTYQVGESFPSADGCNTCTCQSADMIACTEKACLSTPAVSPATKSATTTPSKTTITPIITSKPSATPSTKTTIAPTVTVTQKIVTPTK